MQKDDEPMWEILSDEDVLEEEDYIDDTVYVFDVSDVLGLFTGIQRKHYKDEDAAIKSIAANLENANSFTKHIRFFPLKSEALIHNKRYIYRDKDIKTKFNATYDIWNYADKKLVNFLQDYAKRAQTSFKSTWPPFQETGYPIGEDVQAQIVWDRHNQEDPRPASFKSTPMRILRGEKVNFYGIAFGAGTNRKQKLFNLDSYIKYVNGLQVGTKVELVPNVGDLIPEAEVTDTTPTAVRVRVRDEVYVFYRGSLARILVNKFAIHPPATLPKLYAKAYTLQTPSIVFYQTEDGKYRKVPIRYLLPRPNEEIVYSDISKSCFSLREFEKHFQIIDYDYCKELLVNNLNRLPSRKVIKPPPVIQPAKNSLDPFLMQIEGLTDTGRFYYLIKTYNKLSERILEIYNEDIQAPKSLIPPVPLVDAEAQDAKVGEINVPTSPSLWEAMRGNNGNIIVFNPVTRLFYALENYQISTNTPSIALRYFPDCTYDDQRHVIVPKYSSQIRKPSIGTTTTGLNFKLRHPPIETPPSEIKHSEYNYDSEDDDDIEKLLNNLEFGVQMTEVEELENDEFVQTLVDENISTVIKMFTKPPTKLVLSEKDLVRIRMFSRKHILEADVEAVELEKARAKFTEKAKQNKKSNEWVAALVKDYMKDLQDKGLTDVRYTIIAVVALTILTSFPKKISTLQIVFSFDKSNIIDLLDILIGIVNDQDTSDDPPLDIENAYGVYRRISKKPLWDKLITQAKKSIEDNKAFVNRENLLILDRYFLWNTFKPLEPRVAHTEIKLDAYKMKEEETNKHKHLSFLPSVFIKSKLPEEPKVTFKTPHNDDKRIKNHSFIKQSVSHSVPSLQNVWEMYGDNTTFGELSLKVGNHLRNKSEELREALYLGDVTEITKEDVDYLSDYLNGTLKPILHHIANEKKIDKKTSVQHLPEDSALIAKYKEDYINTIKQFYTQRIKSVCKEALEDPVLATLFVSDNVSSPSNAIYLFAYCISKTLVRVEEVSPRLYEYLVLKLLNQYTFTKSTLLQYEKAYMKQREDDKNDRINKKKVMDRETKFLSNELKKVGIDLTQFSPNAKDDIKDIQQAPRQLNGRDTEIAEEIRNNIGENSD